MAQVAVVYSQVLIFAWRKEKLDPEDLFYLANKTLYLAHLRLPFDPCWRLLTEIYEHLMGSRVDRTLLYPRLMSRTHGKPLPAALQKTLARYHLFADTKPVIWAAQGLMAMSEFIPSRIKKSQVY